ncbi:major tail protein [Enterobacter phage ATCEA23]|nr:uncharacterized protein [Enterobacter phage ATCEA85]QQV93518.1 major tail protein [Enterobacter phage ATCEA23]
MAPKLGYNIPNGSTLQIAETMGDAITVTGISNATEAVATATGAGIDALSPGDYIMLSVDWVNLNGLVCRIKAATEGAITLEGVDTTDANMFPAGGGVGELVKIEKWIDLPLTPTIANAGNEQQTTTFQAIQMERAATINTFKSAATQTFTMAHDATHAARKVLKAYDRSQDPTAFKMYNKRAKETRLYGCQVSFNELPASEVNNVETNTLVLNLISDMQIYPDAN